MIDELTMDEYHHLIDSDNYSPRGLFVVYDKETGNYIAVYNPDGQAWTEEFRSMLTAQRWLAGRYVRNVQGERICLSTYETDYRVKKRRAKEGAILRRWAAANPDQRDEP